jgi:hypothetical protein
MLMLVLRRERVVFVARDFFVATNAHVNAGHRHVLPWCVGVCPMGGTLLGLLHFICVSIPSHVFLFSSLLRITNDAEWKRLDSSRSQHYLLNRVYGVLGYLRGGDSTELLIYQAC